jgi:hypothetical protein
MNNFQKIGGVAAIYEAAAYVVAMVGFLLIVDVSGAAGPIQKLALIEENLTVLYILYLISYVFWGIFLVVLALALYDRLKSGSPAIAQTATAIGLIWAGLAIASGTLYNVGMGTVLGINSTDPAQAGTIWLTIESISAGLTGVEVVGGTWMLLVSWAALRGGGLPRALNYLGLVVGIAGLLTLIPGLEMLAMIFGLGQIVWFIWVGIVMLRSDPGTVEQKSEALVGVS